MKDLRIYGCWRPMPGRAVGSGVAGVGLLWLSLISGSPALAQAQAGFSERIGVGDVVQVIVAGHQELSATVTVDDQGALTLPTVGAIRAAGRTGLELSADI